MNITCVSHLLKTQFGFIKRYSEYKIQAIGVTEEEVMVVIYKKFGQLWIADYNIHTGEYSAGVPIDSIEYRNQSTILPKIVCSYDGKNFSMY